MFHIGFSHSNWLGSGRNLSSVEHLRLSGMGVLKESHKKIVTCRTTLFSEFYTAPLKEVIENLKQGREINFSISKIPPELIWSSCVYPQSPGKGDRKQMWWNDRHVLQGLYRKYQKPWQVLDNENLNIDCHRTWWMLSTGWILSTRLMLSTWWFSI